jgi:hypothetical protein
VEEHERRRIHKLERFAGINAGLKHRVRAGGIRVRLITLRLFDSALILKRLAGAGRDVLEPFALGVGYRRSSIGIA